MDKEIVGPRHKYSLAGAVLLNDPGLEEHGDHGPPLRVHVRLGGKQTKKLTLFLLGKFRSHGGLKKEGKNK